MISVIFLAVLSEKDTNRYLETIVIFLLKNVTCLKEKKRLEGQRVGHRESLLYLWSTYTALFSG